MKRSLQLLTLAMGIPASLANLADSPSTSLHSLQTGDCEIFSSDNKKVRPSSLTLQYESTGINSHYQDSSKASWCHAGMYPWTTPIMVVSKSGVSSLSLAHLVLRQFLSMMVAIVTSTPRVGFRWPLAIRLAHSRSWLETTAQVIHPNKLKSLAETTLTYDGGNCYIHICALCSIDYQ